MKSYPVSSLVVTLQNSYGQVRGALVLLIQLLFVRFLIEGVLLLFSLILFITVGIGSLLSRVVDKTGEQSSYLTSFGAYNTWIFLIGTGIVIGAYLLTALLLQIATLYAVSKEKQHVSLHELFHLSLSQFSPFLFSQLLCAVLILGGFFAFFLPGIGMMLIFSFVPFVVLFEKKSGFSAVRKSMLLFLQKPLSFLGRIVLLWIIGISFNSIFLSNAVTFLGTVGHIFLFLLGNIALWWYGTAYTYLLYKEASTLPMKSSGSFFKVFILSLSGWILISVVAFWTYGFFSSGQAYAWMKSASEKPAVMPKNPQRSYSLKEI